MRLDWRRMPVLAAALAVTCGPALGPAPKSSMFVAEEQRSHTEVRLQAISAVDSYVIWASGLEGTYTRTTDGGMSWQTTQLADARDLQFRDVHAVDASTAYLLSAGTGELSRIFKTTDGGESWQMQFLNQEPEGFLDCFDFWSPERGLAYGDSVRGELFVLTTIDGSTWSRVPPESLPPAGLGEGGFAASGGCVETGSRGRAWIATGAAGHARVLRPRLRRDLGVRRDSGRQRRLRRAHLGALSQRPQRHRPGRRPRAARRLHRQRGGVRRRRRHLDRRRPSELSWSGLRRSVGSGPGGSSHGGPGRLADGRCRGALGNQPFSRRWEHVAAVERSRHLGGRLRRLRYVLERGSRGSH